MDEDDTQHLQEGHPFQREGTFDTNYAEEGIHRINSSKHDWSDLIGNYRTIQSPSKKKKMPNGFNMITTAAGGPNTFLQKLSPQKTTWNYRQELIEEARIIKQDADAIVAASMSKGFFSRVEPETTLEQIEYLLPQFEDVTLDHDICINLDSRTERGSYILSHLSP